MLWLIIFIPFVLAIVLAIVFWRIWPEPMARLFIRLERRQARLQSHRKTSGQTDWHYLEGGHGEPLVLLHGFNADANHFCQVARLLSPHFRIIAPDLPGFGETRIGETTSFRIEDVADQVLEWLDDLGIHEFYLGGNSMGGYLAVAMARRAPERVRALWLLAPGGLRDAKLSAVMEEVAEERHNPLVIRNYGDFQRLLDYCFVRPPWIPSPLARYLAARSARVAVRAQRIFDAIRYDSSPMEELAADLTTPALVIWGQADQVLHVDGAAQMEKLMPDCKTLVLSSIGHLPMLEAPRTTAEAWIGFTESLARQEQQAPTREDT